MPAFFPDDLPELQEEPGTATTPFPNALWKRISESQMGVAVRDPEGHNFGMGIAKRDLPGPLRTIKGWAPIDGKKHTIVGEVDHYKFYDGFGDEADFNIFITPDSAFSYLLDDVVANMTPEEREELQVRTRGDGFCVECEITPDEAYYSNPWFPKKRKRRSPLVGKKLGLYGPWVGDSGHKGRPEIHPCEVIWWKRSLTVVGRTTQDWHITVLQDDSNRFDQGDQFFPPGAHPPWSGMPRRAHIVLALEAQRGRNTTFQINIERHRNVYEHPNELRNIGRTLDSSTTVTVSKEGMSSHGRVKARLSYNVGDDPANGYYRLFLHLFLQIGVDYSGGEGFAEVVVSSVSTGAPLLPIVSRRVKVAVDTPLTDPAEREAAARQ